MLLTDFFKWPSHRQWLVYSYCQIRILTSLLSIANCFLIVYCFIVVNCFKVNIKQLISDILCHNLKLLSVKNKEQGFNVVVQNRQIQNIILAWSNNNYLVFICISHRLLLIHGKCVRAMTIYQNLHILYQGRFYYKNSPESLERDEIVRTKLILNTIILTITYIFETKYKAYTRCVSPIIQVYNQ